MQDMILSGNRAHPHEIFVLEIAHRHGTDLGLHRSERGALRALAEYVRSCWREVEDDAGPVDLLSDEEAIDAYFEVSSKRPQPETYELTGVLLED